MILRQTMSKLSDEKLLRILDECMKFVEGRYGYYSKESEEIRELLKQLKAKLKKKTFLGGLFG